jgi:hypothetical protein
VQTRRQNQRAKQRGDYPHNAGQTAIHRRTWRYPGRYLQPNAIPDNTDDTLLAALTYAVPIKVARSLLGDKARSEIYEAAARGELVLVKDGHKTLVTVASIRSYQAKWPRITVKPAATGRRKQPRQARELDAR